MKKLAFVAVAALLAGPLAACSTFTNLAASVAVSTVADAPIPGQAKTVFGAEMTFDFLVKTAQHFVDSGVATPGQKTAIHTAVVKVAAVNKAAREAAQNGTNAAAATLLASLNAANLDFAGALSAVGIPITK